LAKKSTKILHNEEQKDRFGVLSYLDMIKVEDQKKGGKKPGGNKTGTPVGKTPKGSDTK